jgi:predicted RNase H-like nuclease (RuvC/YqgF family)
MPYPPTSAKITELTAEINKLRAEAEQHQRDHASYVTYEKKAETLAADIKALQAQLADLNMLADHLNTNTDLRQVWLAGVRGFLGEILMGCTCNRSRPLETS